MEKDQGILARIALVVTDLDNTLYDWVTFFATAFYTMVDAAVTRLEVPRDQLLDELQDVHIERGSIEYPFALLETTAVKRAFPDVPRAVVAKELDEVFHSFNRARKATLTLYDGVAETLRRLKEEGVPTVGHTEATVPNALFRLRMLQVEQYFERLYAATPTGEGHPDPIRARELTNTPIRIQYLQPDERKPDPRILAEICRDFAVAPERTLYIGDSRPRDVGMAKAAGVWAAWAEYGTRYDPALWKRLVRITDRSADAVRSDEDAHRHPKADVVLHRSINEIFDRFQFIGRLPKETAATSLSG